VSAILAEIIAFVAKITPLIPTWIKAGADVFAIIQAVEAMIKASGAPASDQLDAANKAVDDLRTQADAELAALKAAAPDS
jgi:hypothetical protein